MWQKAFNTYQEPCPSNIRLASDSLRLGIMDSKSWNPQEHRSRRNIVLQPYAQDFLGWKGYQWQSPKSSPERGTAPQRIEHGQNKFLGHIMRKEAIEDLRLNELNGKIHGKKAREDKDFICWNNTMPTSEPSLTEHAKGKDLGVLCSSLNAM